VELLPLIIKIKFTNIIKVDELINGDNNFILDNGLPKFVLLYDCIHYLSLRPILDFIGLTKKKKMSGYCKG